MVAKARPRTMSWDPHTTYDVSEKELNLMKKRAEMRSQLRAYWVKEFTNPHLRVRLTALGLSPVQPLVLVFR